MAEHLLFGFPLDYTQDGVRFYLTNDEPTPGSNVTEIYYRLDVQFNGAVESFRLPHDLELLWKRLNQSTPTSPTTSDLTREVGSTLPGPTAGSISSPVTPEDPISDRPTPAGN